MKRHQDPWIDFQKAAQSGDEEAARRYFEALYQSVSDELVRFATWCTKQHNAELLPAHLLDAPEIAQDAFTELYLQRHSIRKDPHDWILGTINGIVRYRVSAAWRELKSKKEGQRQLNRWQRPRRVESSVTRNVRRQIRAIVKSLSPRVQTVIRMLYFDDESVATTAQRLGITPNAVIQARRRALKQIEGLLKLRGVQF